MGSWTSISAAIPNFFCGGGGGETSTSGSALQGKTGVGGGGLALRLRLRLPPPLGPGSEARGVLYRPTDQVASVAFRLRLRLRLGEGMGIRHWAAGRFRRNPQFCWGGG